MFVPVTSAELVTDNMNGFVIVRPVRKSSKLVVLPETPLSYTEEIDGDVVLVAPVSFVDGFGADPFIVVTSAFPLLALTKLEFGLVLAVNTPAYSCVFDEMFATQNTNPNPEVTVVSR